MKSILIIVVTACIVLKDFRCHKSNRKPINIIYYFSNEVKKQSKMMQGKFVL